MLLTVTVEGLGELQTWLTKVAAGLEKVPQKFSERDDVKQELQAVARIALERFRISHTGIAIENVRAESTPDHKGIVVYEALNAATASKGGKGGAHAGEDPYILFFLQEYAPVSFLKPEGVAMGRDFFRLWPELMKTTVLAAFDGEVMRALK
jgi:hypothetical protein